MKGIRRTMMNEDLIGEVMIEVGMSLIDKSLLKENILKGEDDESK